MTARAPEPEAGRPAAEPHRAARRSVDEHREHVAELLALDRHDAVELVALDRAAGRVSARAIVSPVDLPLFRNAQMDGFAVRAADVAQAPVELPVAAVIAAAAGRPPALEPGTAVRIMTGAPVPEGADAIVPVEDTTPRGEGLVRLERARAVGEFVREQGDDLAAGAELVPAGVRLAPRHVAALAAAGVAHVPVRARVRVAVLTTGSELVAPGDAVSPGQVFDANGPALAAAVEAVGGEVVLRERCADDPAAFAVLLAAATDAADLVLTAGGISQGDFEVVRETLEPHGAWVGGVAMQPGGPQATARFAGVPVVCFPGNPVSAQLSFELFVAPLLREAAGLPAAGRERRTLTVDVASVPGRLQLLRGRAVGADRIEPVSGAGSHLVAGMARADRIIAVPAEVESLTAGSVVEAWVL